ncbi:MAG: hypothetical protein JXR60_10830 [Bacteroidales bacterium]|nr:hypothetical protein [Bacteroidales bacterium]
MSKLFAFVFINVFVIHLYAQNTVLQDAEVELKSLYDSLFKSDNTKFIQPDSIKIQLSNAIDEIWPNLLTQKESFYYLFDSIRYFGSIYSQDKKVRIISWNIKLEGGIFKYFGYIQVRNGDDNIVYHLKDKGDSLLNDTTIETLSLTQKDWMGQNYYDIVDFKYRGKKMYAIMGMRHNGYISKMKTIDILYFTGRYAKFGKNIFKYDEKKKAKRIIFEYNHNVSMVLHYDKRYNMIVYDHLSPEKPYLKGQYRFYAPDGSYDGFMYNGSKWVYRPEEWIVNERNKKQEELKETLNNKNIYERR